MFKLYKEPIESVSAAGARLEAVIAQCDRELAMPAPSWGEVTDAEVRRATLEQLTTRRYGPNLDQVLCRHADGTLLTYEQNGCQLALRVGASKKRTVVALPNHATLTTHRGVLYAANMIAAVTVDHTGTTQLYNGAVPAANTIEDYELGCYVDKRTREFHVVSSDLCHTLINNALASTREELEARSTIRYRRELHLMLMRLVPFSVRRASALEELQLLNTSTTMVLAPRPVAELTQGSYTVVHGNWLQHTVLEAPGHSVTLSLGSTLKLHVNGVAIELPWPAQRPASVTLNGNVVSAQIAGVWYAADFEGRATQPIEYQLTSRGEIVPMPALITIDRYVGYGRATIGKQVFDYVL